MIQVGPVLVTVVPARTAKFPAPPSPGSVAARALAGEMTTRRAATLKANSGRRISFTDIASSGRHNNVSKRSG